MQNDPFNKPFWASFGGASAIVAGLAVGWGYIRAGCRWLSLLVVGRAVVKDTAGAAVMAYAVGRSKKSPICLRIFGGVDSYVHPKRWNETVGYEAMSPDPVLIKFNGHHALVRTLDERKSGIGEVRNFALTVTVFYLRGFFDMEGFVVAALDYHNSQKRNNDPDCPTKGSRFRIHRRGGLGKSTPRDMEPPNSRTAPSAANDVSQCDNMLMTGVFRLLKWKREDLIFKPEEGQSPFTGYPFPKAVAEAIKEFDYWMNNEKWFRSKSIPWRRGWLLHGPPGTGKSTLVRAMGMTFDLPVFMFDLAGMNNNDLMETWDNMLDSTPCIALVEDIDAIFEGRKNVASSSAMRDPVTYDCFLNCISGVKQSDGVFLIVTTNRLDKLDPALGIPDSTGRSTRPGRIDRTIHLGPMEQPERQLLAEHILKEYPDLIDTAVLDGDGETAAQFQNRCAQLALARFWAEKVISTNGHDRSPGQKLNGRSCAALAEGNGAVVGCLGGRDAESSVSF